MTKRGEDERVADKEEGQRWRAHVIFFGLVMRRTRMVSVLTLSFLPPSPLAMSSVARILVHHFCSDSPRQHSSSSLLGHRTSAIHGLGTARLPLPKLVSGSFHRNPFKPSAAGEGVVPFEDDPENGVSLGTVKLPSNTDIATFEGLLFQWANSLCQGANLPFPVPLKVDKVRGGVRLGFIRIGEGKTEVPVYIDCLVFAATESSGPIFRAIRNGALKDKPPPGEPRIMRSLLPALKKSIEIATV